MKPFIPISAYKPALSAKTGGIVPGCIPYETDFYTEMEHIKNGYYKKVVDQCRTIADKKERTAFKAQHLPAITISAVCKDWRKTANIVSHSGLMNVDIDDSNNDVEDWSKLRDTLSQSKIIVAAFLSVSGKGLSLVVKINPEEHYDAYRNIQQELEKRFGILVDSGVHDVVRLRFVSYDPDAFINYDFENIPVVELTEEYKQERDRKKLSPVPVLATGAANSFINFNNAVAVAQRDHSFCDGEKHYFLVALAGYCNTTGMDEDVCCRYVIQAYSSQTSISEADLLQPIRNVYRRYSHQFNETPLRKASVSRKVLRWLLTYIEKGFLRKHLDYYGLKLLPGESTFTIKVSSPLLCFFMWLACPEYTWTTLEEYDQVFTNEECKDVVLVDALLDSCNGNRCWIYKQHKYPVMWG